MSYEIIYDKQFIKAEKEGKIVFFPMLYMGSNNCYEVGRGGKCGRRERDWHNSTYLLKGERFGTLEEMMLNVEEEKKRVIESCEKSFEQYKEEWCKYSDKRWGSHTSLSFGGGCKSTFGQYKGLYKTGCEKALTVEELKEFNVPVKIYTNSFYYREDDLKKFKEAGKEEINYVVNTSEELMAKLEEFAEYLKDTPYASLYVSIDASEYDMKKIREVKFPKSRKELKTVDKFYIIKDTLAGHYFIKGAKRGYTYTYQGQLRGKKFAKETDAKKCAKKINDKMRTNFIVEEVNEIAQVRV